MPKLYSLPQRRLLMALICLINYFYTTAQPGPAKDSLGTDPAYIIEDSVLIRTRDGAHISALIVRKRGITEPQATILQFTVYTRKTDLKKAKETADRGYVGMIAYTRGKRYSPDEVIPYEHDGDDVYDLIDWISAQFWSNQKVGMYGGSYNGFTQWAATKHLHPALKTIVPSAAVAPGLDVPMMNNVIMSFAFPWTYYVSNNKFLDEADYRSPQWGDLYQKWYDQGRSYRSLDTLIQRPGNTLFHRWLNHPAYDTYWQAMIPYKEEFAKITIPVLTTTGYYDGGQVGAMYYLRAHYAFNPQANHYLLIGPYGHLGSQGYPDSTYNGYTIDSVANVPIHTIIFQWFDYILKNKAKPAILKDRINYQVMGTNKWKHAASLSKMSNDTLTFYLSNKSLDKSYKLLTKKSLKPNSIKQTIDFSDRTTQNSYYYANRIIYDELTPNNGLLFISNPIETQLEVNGCFSGILKAVINKKDMDFSVALFEIMPDGRYFYLSYFMGRASYATDNTQRHILTPGKEANIPFTNSYLTSRKVSKGSRIAIVVNVNKSPFEQINYGTGKDVNLETIKDSDFPLHISWSTESYIKIPVLK